MPKYLPIPVLNIKSSMSDLRAFRWVNSGITADFVIPLEDDRALRVRFDKVEVVRLLDEMPLSTELEETPNEGLVPDHFAYTVQGSSFWLAQSEALKLSIPGLQHYRFVTGWTCLDVISARSPQFSVVAFDENRPWQDGPEHKPDRPGRRRVVATARAMLDGKLSFIEGARELSRLRHHVGELERDPDILVFTGIDSQTDALPLGETRKLWAPDALAKLQPEIDRAEKRAEAMGRPRCEALLRRFDNLES